ncbi:MAG: ArsR/SmtB family transcription factor [Mycetocola sp.]
MTPPDASESGALVLGTVLSALAHPARRGIIADLAAEPGVTERACGSFDLPVSKATKTHHFTVLREAGLVLYRNHGNGSTLTLRRDEINRDLPGLLGLLIAERADRAESTTTTSP